MRNSTSILALKPLESILREIDFQVGHLDAEGDRRFDSTTEYPAKYYWLLVACSRSQSKSLLPAQGVNF